MNKKTVRKIRLNDEQTTRLLKLGLNDSEVATHQDPENERKELVSDMLCSKLPVDRMLMKELPVLVKSLSDELEAISGSSVRECLFNPETKASFLRHVKDYARDSGHSAYDKAQGEVAKVVYFAAIAAALLHHGVKISGHSYHDLKSSFGLCSQQNWIPNDLKEFFIKAKDICKRKQT